MSSVLFVFCDNQLNVPKSGNVSLGASFYWLKVTAKSLQPELACGVVLAYRGLSLGSSELPEENIRVQKWNYNSLINMLFLTVSGQNGSCG